MGILGVIRQFLPEIGASVGLLTALFGLHNYYRQTKLEKLKWIQQLYEKFYNTDQYRLIRQKIDFDNLDDLLPLLQKDETESRNFTLEQCNQLDQFTDYLNFFEWIAFSEKKGQLSYNDLDVMFNYYLARIVIIDKRHQGQIGKYMKDNGYEQLFRLLSDHYSLR